MMQKRLKKNFKSLVILGLTGTFITIILTTMIVLNNKTFTSSSRANIIDDSTQYLLDHLDLETECFMDSNCKLGYVCRKTDPQSSIKRCLVCQQLSCPAPARTVKYGKLCLNASCDDAGGSAFYSTQNCQDGTFVSYDKNRIDAWCRSENISIEFLIQLTKKDDSNLPFTQMPGNAYILLNRYDTAQSPPQELSTQKIEVQAVDFINPNPHRTYRFETILKAADIEEKRNMFKVWLQIPPYTDASGKQIESPWISSEEIVIDKNNTNNSYEIILAY